MTEVLDPESAKIGLEFEQFYVKLRREVPHSAKGVRVLIFASEVDMLDRISSERARLKEENRRLRERLGPRGLEVVMIDGVGHYVNEKVKAEIDRLRTPPESGRYVKSGGLEGNWMPSGGNESDPNQAERDDD